MLQAELDRAAARLSPSNDRQCSFRQGSQMHGICRGEHRRAVEDDNLASRARHLDDFRQAVRTDAPLETKSSRWNEVDTAWMAVDDVAEIGLTIQEFVQSVL